MRFGVRRGEPGSDCVRWGGEARRKLSTSLRGRGMRNHIRPRVVLRRELDRSSDSRQLPESQQAHESGERDRRSQRSGDARCTRRTLGVGLAVALPVTPHDVMSGVARARAIRAERSRGVVLFRCAFRADAADREHRQCQKQCEHCLIRSWRLRSRCCSPSPLLRCCHPLPRAEREPRPRRSPRAEFPWKWFVREPERGPPPDW